MSGEDPSKPKDGNLLDNVSLMTTISPMPSQNNSLQPQGVTGTQDLLDGIFTNTGKSPFPKDTMDEKNMSTAAAIEQKLLAHLGDTGTTLGSTTTPPTTNQRNPSGTNTGGEKIMYGFDLSPIHSVDKGSVYTTTQEDPPSTEKLRNRGEFRMAPNFMQAKVVPRQLKSQEKSGANEDTETMMSQVFSSQDVTSSLNENFLGKSKDDLKLDESAEHRETIEAKVKGAQRPGTKPESKPSKYPNEKKYGLTMSLKFRPTTTATKGKAVATKSTPVRKSMSSPSIEVVTPKSPKTRQSAVKVTPRMKASSKKQMRKPTLQKSKQSLTPSKGPPHQSGEVSLDSPTHSRTYKSSMELSQNSLRQSKPEKKTHEETVSLIHILEDLNEMRAQVAEAQEQLHVVSNERDKLLKENSSLQSENTQLKKDNFVMKSRLDKFASGKINDSHDGGKQSAGTDDEAAKLKQDIAEQERLIIGYQKENERIYGELKKAKENSRETEQAMYEENLKLKSEVSKLREELELQSVINRAHGSDSSDVGQYNRDMADVTEDDLNHVRHKITSLENQIRAEEGLRSKAENVVRKVTAERDAAEKRLSVDQCKAEESRDKLIIEHKAEVERLKSELAEARRLVANKNDVMTIRDLMHSPPSKSMLSHFQRRVKKLESDLENRDTVANKAVSSVQQQYTHIKAKYEERIDDLEKQIKAFRVNMEKNPTGSSDLAKEKHVLEKKLSEALSKLNQESESRVRERDALFDQINMLRQQHSTTQQKKMATDNTSATELKLQKECELKDQQIGRLSSLVHKLGEKSAIDKRPRNNNKNFGGDRKSVPSYNPGTFEGEGYADLIAQNASLKKELENKELEYKHAEVTKEAVIAKLEQEVKSRKAEYEKELMRLRENHSERPENSQTNGILVEKISRFEGELSRRCKEVAELKNDLKEASVSKIREQALQLQIQQLVGKLHNAQSTSPSSSARKIKALEDKLHILEEQLRIKNIELKSSLINNSSSFVQKEIQNMQSEIERKNREMTKFRLELDSILLVLKELHSQGVKIPLPKYLQSIF